MLRINDHVSSTRKVRVTCAGPSAPPSTPARQKSRSRSEGKLLSLLAAALVAIIAPSAWSAPPGSSAPTPTLLASGLVGSVGSTVGPDGSLYVGEGGAGRISRIDT